MKYLTNDEKLLYMSKSKYNLYLTCPYAIKLKYLDGIKQQDTPWMKFGREFHDFSEEFFDKVRVIKGKLKIPEFSFIPKDKKLIKNFLRFEIKRWKKIYKIKKHDALRYFKPLINEEFITTEEPKYVGVPDRVHLTLNDDIVIVENKTGMPTKSKNRKYENDALWYKLILEADDRFYNVEKGAIYYPYNNHVHKFTIDKQKVLILKNEIDNVREKMMNKEFGPNPGRVCKRCLFNHACEYSTV